MPTFSSTLSNARAPFLLVPLLFAAAAHAANPATISGPVTAAQTIGAGQTLTVTNTGALTVNKSAVAVSVSGNGATINNAGAIAQTGSARAIIDTGLTTNLTVNNAAGASITTVSSDVIQLGNSAGESATLNNYGTLQVTSNPKGAGAQAVDFNAVTGANAINNYTGALLQALNADAVRPGINGTVYNAGTIRSTITDLVNGSGSDGVDLQKNATGVAITNAGTGLIDGSRHGITGGTADPAAAFLLTVTNAAGGVIKGQDGSGINIDGLNGKEVVTITNAGTITGHGVTGDGDGVDVDGLVNLINTGVIKSLNAVPAAGESIAYSEGLSVGGGTITNSGTIQGLLDVGNATAKAIGITLTGNDITTGPNTGNRDGLYGNTVVTNQAGGLISGQNSSAIVAKGLASGYSLSITNAAGGVIQGGGSTDAAIQLGADSATLTNSGKIDGSASGKAIDMGTAGNNKVIISGGQAVVLGSINGGTGGGNSLKIDAGAGNSFSFASGIANFDKVEVASGTTTLSGTSSYTGTTVIDHGATLVLDGANRLAAGSKLDLEGGALKLVDVAGANGQAFAVLSLGQSSSIDLGDSSLTFDALGSVVAGTTLTVTDYLASASPTYALRFAGDLTHNAAFLALMGGTTIDSLAATYHFDGHYTDVTAVPEPANVALLLAGLGLVGAAVRRRKQGAEA